MFQQKQSGKVLLFGEYTLLNGGEALAIPLQKYGGWWEYAGLEDKQQNLKEFCEYLSEQKALRPYIDIPAFETALEKSLYFNSNIPTGYGAGSSGALCAAVLKVFGNEDSYNKANLSELKAIFSSMEGFFHGASSGLDPLVSFLNQAIRITADGNLIPIESFKGPEGLNTFLVDTKKTRQTEPLVKWHLQKCEDEKYKSALDLELLPNNNRAIAAYLDKNAEQFWQALHNISQFQLAHFTQMVPMEFHKVWQQGLDSDDFKIKICGAGGGGFMLLFAKTKPSNFPFDLIDIFEQPLSIGAQVK